MFKKFVVAALVLLFGFAAVEIAFAGTVDMRESECLDNDYYWYEDTCYETEKEKLRTQVSALQEKVNKLLAKLEEETEQKEEEQETEEEPTSEELPPECAGVGFDRALKRGMKGEDVRCLQVILNRELERPIANSGPGSPGNETSYFGPLTKAGVKRFQEEYEQDILAPWSLSRGTGYVGRTTRERLNEFLKNKEQPDRGQDQEQLTYCEADSDCTLVNENCCGCENGGSKKCINKDYQQSWKSELNCEERVNVVCPTVYLCDSLPSGCECVDNTCRTSQ